MVIAGLLLDFHPGFTCSEKGAGRVEGKIPMFVQNEDYTTLI